MLADHANEPGTTLCHTFGVVIRIRNRRKRPLRLLHRNRHDVIPLRVLLVRAHLLPVQIAPQRRHLLAPPCLFLDLRLGDDQLLARHRVAVPVVHRALPPVAERLALELQHRQVVECRRARRELVGRVLADVTPGAVGAPLARARPRQAACGEAVLVDVAPGVALRLGAQGGPRGRRRARERRVREARLLRRREAAQAAGPLDCGRVRVRRVVALPAALVDRLLGRL